MAIKLVKMGTSAVVGAADIITDYIDEKREYVKSFQNVTDWLRFVEVVGGYGANYYKYGDEDITESVVLSSMPLFEKSLYGAVKEYVLQGKGEGEGRMGLKLKKPGRKPASPGQIRWG